MRFPWLQAFLATAMVMCIVGSSKADPAGSATGGTAGTQSWAAGCVYNATPPVLTNGQQATVQCGASGSLNMIATGAAANGAAVSGNPILIAGYDGALTRTVLTDTAGRVTITGAYTAGSTAPSSALVGAEIASDGVNGRLLTTDTGGKIILSATPSPVCTSVLPFSQTASADLHTATGKSYICSIVLISATQQQVSLIEGTGSTCGTGTAALLGGTSASMAVAANGGFSSVSASPWLKMQTTSDHLCLLQSGVGNVSGTITYVDAP